MAVVRRHRMWRSFARAKRQRLKKHRRYGKLPYVYFELAGDGDIASVETIAVNVSIRERNSLHAKYGGKRWRKLKGIATVRIANGEQRRAEVHWYEAHGVGKRKMKIKRLLN